NSYKGLPVFDAMTENWPLFYLKIRLYLESKDLLNIITRDNDKPVHDKGKEQAAQRAKEAGTRAKDDLSENDGEWFNQGENYSNVAGGRNRFEIPSNNYAG
ncbi:hypothetical protein HDU78_010504, partial [Chytriomyces hyalinus]